MDIGTSRAAEILGCTQSLVSKMCREGKFKTATQDGPGRPWHISETEIRDMAKRRKRK